MNQPRNDTCMHCGKSGATYVRGDGGLWHKHCLPPREGKVVVNALTSIPVRFKRMGNHELPLPAHATAAAAGLDLMSTGAGWLRAGEYGLWRTGWAVELPDGFEGQVRPRSGLALKHGVTVLNSPGTLDSDFRGEIGVILINHGTDSFQIKVGDRIAQLVIAPVMQVQGREVAELMTTARGAGGFGSTGQ